jgi:hypothetical protein
MSKRGWVPDIERLAEQLVEDVRNADKQSGFLDAVGTFASWEGMAAERGEEITTDDYQALCIRLAQMYVNQ